MNVLILHLPTTVMAFGAQGTLHAKTLAYGYNIFEKIQMVGFFLQETILSSIYIAETAHILRTSLRAEERRQRQTLQQLIAINLTIILMDLVLLSVEAASLYILQILLKGLVYSLKLKLEFAILNKLVSIVPKPTSPLSLITTANHMDAAISEIVDLTKIKTDFTHASIESGNLRKDNVSELELARFEHDLNAGRL
ncbi:hypothetical protein Slin15195_G062630 [Septoria linicola]|uniref:DUF7703 domain-containing protein n=1 Tax=Septoria linicola TaxID=215465 RepID=A0A9Q9AR11_9PEZI|nr:hypothetical protein Slin15195_G062630 [Septoria linicola]